MENRIVEMRGKIRDKTVANVGTGCLLKDFACSFSNEIAWARVAIRGLFFRVLSCGPCSKCASWLMLVE
jgi:hypothetical protein